MRVINVEHNDAGRCTRLALSAGSISTRACVARERDEEGMHNGAQDPAARTAAFNSWHFHHPGIELHHVINMGLGRGLKCRQVNSVWDQGAFFNTLLW